MSEHRLPRASLQRQEYLAPAAVEIDVDDAVVQHRRLGVEVGIVDLRAHEELVPGGVREGARRQLPEIRPSSPARERAPEAADDVPDVDIAAHEDHALDASLLDEAEELL